MGELRRILSKRTVIAIITIFIINILVFVLVLPNQDSEERFEARRKYANKYSQDIDAVLKQADKMLAIDIFSEEGSYSYKNILKTQADYMRVADLDFVPDNDRVTEAVINYPFVNILVTGLMIYILYGICLERSNGMMAITYSTGQGRKMLALRRAMILIGLSVLVTVLLTVTNLIIGCFLFGIDDFGGPIQTLPEFADYTYLHSKGFFIILTVLKNAFFCSVLTMFAYMLCNMFANVKISLLLLAGIFVLEKILQMVIGESSWLRILKYCNIVNLLDCTDVCRRYVNVNLMGNCVSYDYVLNLLAVIMIILSFTVSILMYRKTAGSRIRLLDRAISRISEAFQKMLCGRCFVIKELWKILVIKKNILLIILYIFIFGFVWNYTVIDFPKRQRDMDAVYLQYGGADWTAFEGYMTDLEKEIADYRAQSQTIMDKIQSGEAGFDQMIVANELAARATVLNKHLMEYNSKVELRDKVKIELGIDTYVISDRGYNEAIGTNSYVRESIYGIMVLIFIILITMSAFEIEKESGTKPLLISTHRGGRRLYARKLTITLSLCIMCMSIIHIADYMLLHSTYTLVHGKAPVQSLTYMADISQSISIGGFCILQTAVRIVYYLVILAGILVIVNNKKQDNKSFLLLMVIGAGLGYILLMMAPLPIWYIWLTTGVIAIILLMMWAYRLWNGK